MTNQSYYRRNSGLPFTAALARMNVRSKTVVGVILIFALFAFEIFNFDTTRFALASLLGDIRFLRFQWAGILAIAFCSIDFAGLVRLFTPQRGRDEPKETWYLMGAWLLGATMNAVMTWWAVSLTLLNHGFGNEVLSREQLLFYVPIFVAVLVWLTRILFIGAFSVAGDHIFDFSSAGGGRRRASTNASGRARRPATVQRQLRQPLRRTAVPKQVAAAASHGDSDEDQRPNTSSTSGSNYRPSPAPMPKRQPVSRVRQRPPMPNGVRRMPLGGVQARGQHNS